MNMYFKRRLSTPAIIPKNICPKICSRLGLLTISGFPIMYELSGKRNPVREKQKDRIEKIAHVLIKNFIDQRIAFIIAPTLKTSLLRTSENLATINTKINENRIVKEYTNPNIVKLFKIV